MYNHNDIEKKWISNWESNKIFKTEDFPTKEVYYSLAMFPYPSGSGLHIGHVRTYVGWDIFSKFKRMQGYEVLQPMGWDAFGLPAEEYAIKNKEHPSISTQKNINNFKKQITRLGIGVDWDREINTTDPNYYKWTQWIFLQLFKRGLVYESNSPVNWCPDCLTVLANEDLEAGACERCGSQIERKKLRQWVIRITDYADRLLEDLDLLDKWPEFIKDIQKNWIGRSEGYKIPFNIKELDKKIEVFTTRPDTLYGCSFLVFSPESSTVNELLEIISNKNEIEEYQRESFVKKANERDDKDQTGVLCEGVNAIHPITKQEVPIYIADYVLSGYGTGVVFGSPAHDERDYNFAVKYNLPIIRVIEGDEELPAIKSVDSDKIINSEEFTGLTILEAKEKLTEAAGGERAVSYKLQDWVFSRQRYWGEPIPLIHCKKCGVVPVPEKELPLILPNINSYEPTGTGESPLANVEEWINVECPECSGPGKRETNTMPTWAGSSWYQMRYIDPKNDSDIIDKEKEKKWMPVDTYVGGAEHAARHLIFGRFWHKVLYDMKVVHTSEPYLDLRIVGIVLNKEGTKKLSKRDGDAASPNEIIDTLGADTLRTAIASIAPFNQSTPWLSEIVIGPRRLIEKVEALKNKVKDNVPDDKTLHIQHQTIVNVKRSYETFTFNTAVSAITIFSNELHKLNFVPRESYLILIKLLAPMAPFITEELHSQLGEKGSIHKTDFPIAEDKYIKISEANIAIQVLGKIRGTVYVSIAATESEVIEKIFQDERLAGYIEDMNIKVYIPGKIISFV